MPFSATEIEKFLASIQPFKALDKTDIGQPAFKVTEKTFAKGETVYNEGEVADSVWRGNR